VRIPGALLVLAVLAGGAAPAEALSIGPPDCNAFDRALREGVHTAVVRIVRVGATRREGGVHVTRVRAVVEELVNGRGVRRDQTLDWEDRVSEESLDLFGMDRPV